MRTKLHVLAAPASMQTAQELRRIVGGVSDLHLTLLPLGSMALPAEGSFAPSVLLYEMPMTNEAGLETLEAMLGNIPEETAVFVIGQIDSPTLMRGLMQRGVRDVLHEPLEEQELLQALDRVLEEKREQVGSERASTVVAFFNAQGNSGATLLAVNCATALARQQKASVALLDFDLQFGKAALFLDLKSQKHMLDALRDAERLDPVFLKALMGNHESGVHVLAAPPTPSPLEVQKAAVHKVIATAASMYDVVIIDLPRIINAWTLEAMLQCDKVLLLTQNTLSAIRDTRQLLDFLPRQGLALANLEVVNSRAMSHPASTSIAHMKKVLGLERIHRIRNDFATALSAEDQGQPLMHVAPQSVLTEDIENLARHIWRVRHPGVVETPVQSSGWLSRWRNRSTPATPGV